MKKAAAASFALFFSAIFLISLYQYSSNYKATVRSIPSQYRYSIEVNAPEPEIIDAMIAIAQVDEVSIVRQVNYRDENNVSVTKDFFYNIEKYEKRLELVSGRMLTQTDVKSTHFVSTENTGSSEQVGELYHFGKSISYYATVIHIK